MQLASNDTSSYLNHLTYAALHMSLIHDIQIIRASATNVLQQ